MVQLQVFSVKPQYHQEQKNQSQSQKYEKSNCTETGFNPGRDKQSVGFSSRRFPVSEAVTSG
jgi:hypothetical protein